MLIALLKIWFMSRFQLFVINIEKEEKKKYGAHSHVRATARLEEHIIHSRGQRYVVPLARPYKSKN